MERVEYIGQFGFGAVEEVAAALEQYPDDDARGFSAHSSTNWSPPENVSLGRTARNPERNKGETVISAYRKDIDRLYHDPKIEAGWDTRASTFTIHFYLEGERSGTQCSLHVTWTGDDDWCVDDEKLFSAADFLDTIEDERASADEGSLYHSLLAEYGEINWGTDDQQSRGTVDWPRTPLPFLIGSPDYRETVAELIREGKTYPVAPDHRYENAVSGPSEVTFDSEVSPAGEWGPHMN